MSEVASRELRNNTGSLLDRVDAGEAITITVDGRPVAALQPLGRRPRWLSRSEFVGRIVPHRADADLAGPSSVFSRPTRPMTCRCRDARPR